MPSEQELAYLAGLFDGEGCININHHKPQTGKRTEQHTLRCQVLMTDKDSVELFHKMFFGSVSYYPPKTKIKASWKWVVTSNQALEFLQTICPYLKLKQPQANIAISFQLTRKGKRGSIKVSESELASRNEFYLTMKELNK